jgi:ATP-dependent RNA helicase RhlE
VVEHLNKSDLLRDLLASNGGTVLVFARTRHGARKVAKHVRGMGHTAAELHSDRTLAQRKTALNGFKTGQFRVLVATDIAARGIDVKGISLVINYDLPDNPEDYVHRIGRTGRAGEKGRAITLATPEQSKDVRDIEKTIRTEIPLADGSPLAMHRPKPPQPKPAPYSHRFHAHGSRPKSRQGQPRSRARR